MIPISGYADRWCVGQNQDHSFQSQQRTWTNPIPSDSFRITCADPNPIGPGIIEEDLSSVYSGQFSVTKSNPSKLGSYARVEVKDKLDTPGPFHGYSQYLANTSQCRPTVNHLPEKQFW